MCIRRKVRRQIAFKVATVPVQLCAEPLLPVRLQQWTHQVIDPYPRKRTEGHFERADPIHAAEVRVRRPPALEFVLDLEQVLLTAGQPARLREQHEVLVAIELPHDLVIANAFQIQVRNRSAVGRSATDSVNVIAAPINVWTRVDLET